MSNIRLSEDMIGKKVRCIYKDGCYHPEVGTIGTIVRYDSYDKSSSYKIQWPKGSTIGDDEWWAYNDYIELVEDGKTSKQEIPDMTNKEIWKMLENKMQKNGFHYSLIYDKNNIEYEMYSRGLVFNLIAIAYRSGYERAMKGRPFKFGEKKEKKGGHWEPVDPKNLPKEGTKVRYTRHIDDTGAEPFSEWTGIQIGEETFVRYVGKEFFVKDIHNRYPGSGGVCSSVHPERFDMWVEDDE